MFKIIPSYRINNCVCFFIQNIISSLSFDIFSVSARKGGVKFMWSLNWHSPKFLLLLHSVLTSDSDPGVLWRMYCLISCCLIKVMEYFYLFFDLEKTLQVTKHIPNSCQCLNHSLEFKFPIIFGGTLILVCLTMHIP